MTTKFIAPGRVLIEMETEQIDQIVRETLKDDYRRVMADIREVNKKNETEPLDRIDKEDLEDWTTLRLGLERVLHYYMADEDCKAFIKRVKEGD